MNSEYYKKSKPDTYLKKTLQLALLPGSLQKENTNLVTEKTCRKKNHSQKLAGPE